MYEHNALGYWSGLALCLTKVRSSRARCPATALIDRCFQCLLNSDIHVILFTNQRTNGPVNAHLRSASYTNKHI